jgi:hypothetical protein
MAPARRRFIDVLEHDPAQFHQWVVVEVRKLYAVESWAREQGLSSKKGTPCVRKCLCRSWPPSRAAWTQCSRRCFPKSPLSKAIHYALAEWPALNRYLEAGRPEINNNLSENALRPSCVGKKSYLFFGHPEAGWRSAIIYSIIISCRGREIDPWIYFRDLVHRLPDATYHDILNLVPARWKPVA